MEELLKLLKEINSEIDFANGENLVDGGVLDSIGIVEIISAIEEKYGISIEPEQIDPDNFQSAQAMWNMITQIQKEQH